jgi:hypothetical protein
VRRRDRDEGTHVRKFALVAPRGGLKKLGRNQIPMDFAAWCESLFLQINPARARYRCALRFHLGCHY